MMKTVKKTIKLKKPDNPIVVALGKRQGAGSGFREDKKYTRKKKHKKNTNEKF